MYNLLYCPIYYVKHLYLSELHKEMTRKGFHIRINIQVYYEEIVGTRICLTLLQQDNKICRQISIKILYTYKCNANK